MLSQSSNTYELSRSCCPPDNNAKNLKISQLKSQIYQLDEDEKKYNELLQKYNQKKNEYELTNEAKLRLEYELKQKNEATNKILNDLKAQNVELCNELKDKDCINQKLLADNQNLYRNLEDRKTENENFNRAFADNENMINHLSQDKAQCEHDIMSLNDTSQKNQDNINFLSNQLDGLKIRSKNQNDELNAKNAEVNCNQKYLNDIKCDNATLTNKINLKNNSLETIQKQLSLANKSILDLQNELNNLGKEHSRGQDQLENLKINFQNERTVRTRAESENAKLENILKDRDDTLNKLAVINDSLKVKRDEFSAKKNKLLGDVEKYKNYIMVLTEQTQKLTDELQRIVDEDSELYNLTNAQIQRLQQIIFENKKLLADEINALKNLENYVRQMPVCNNNVSTSTVVKNRRTYVSQSQC